MSLSEAEIEARLALLRQRREGLDREIADLVLYRELGRRFGAAGTRTEAASEPAFDPPSVPPTNRAASALVRAQPGPRSAGHADDPEAGGAIPPAIPFTEDAAGARRYGRALVEAARRTIAEAGRPLHAAEILSVLVSQGFTVPGRDPVAALNTRLWKRSGPDGPLRRVGEATYALAAPA